MNTMVQPHTDHNMYQHVALRRLMHALQLYSNILLAPKSVK